MVACSAPGVDLHIKLLDGLLRGHGEVAVHEVAKIAAHRLCSGARGAGHVTGVVHRESFGVRNSHGVGDERLVGPYEPTVGCDRGDQASQPGRGLDIAPR